MAVRGCPRLYAHFLPKFDNQSEGARLTRDPAAAGARVLAVTNGKDSITKDEVDEICAMFIDAKQSSVILTENADKFIS